MQQKSKTRPRRPPRLGRIGKVVGLVLLSPLAALALFGFGDIVFDPSSYATLGSILKSDADTLTKTMEILTQTAKIAVDARRTADLVEGVIDHFESKDRWLTGAAQAGHLYVKDAYGENVNFARVLNGDYQYAAIEAGRAWDQATQDPGDTAYLAGETRRSRKLAQLATVEQADAASVNCAQMIAQYRYESEANEQAIEQLRSDQASGGSNSQTRQTNMINAVMSQQLSEGRSSNALQTCLAQQQIVSNKFRRDQLAEQVQFEGEMAAQPATGLSAQNTVDALRHGWNHQAGEGGN
jgi:type IV secretion system protein TrbJ